jgi:enoyl-CoA hydratase/carnithine racemase
MTSVLYNVHDRVAHVTLNDPSRRNAMTKAMQTGLLTSLRQADADPDVSVVLLSATGETFSAGGDLRLMKTLRDRRATEIHQEARRSADLFAFLQKCTKPIVAAVNGAALGGGFGLVCASSIVIASQTATFGCTELKLGLFPLVILPAVRQALGDRKALELSLTAEVFDAEKARSLGIVNQVVAPATLAETAAAVAERISSFSPIAVRMGMKAFRDTTGLTAEAAIEHLLALRVLFCHTDDLHEGASAFLEKRQPKWVGR